MMQRWTCMVSGCQMVSITAAQPAGMMFVVLSSCTLAAGTSALPVCEPAVEPVATPAR